MTTPREAEPTAFNKSSLQRYGRSLIALGARTEFITYRLDDAMPATLRHEWAALLEIGDELKRRTKTVRVSAVKELTPP